MLAYDDEAWKMRDDTLPFDYDNIPMLSQAYNVYKDIDKEYLMEQIEIAENELDYLSEEEKAELEHWYDVLEKHNKDTAEFAKLTQSHITKSKWRLPK